MRELTIDDLNEAAKIGGPSTLSEKTVLEPAAGAEGVVAPAKYTNGNASTYVFEDRFVAGEAKKTVLVDSRTSQNNRLEDYIGKAMESGHPIFSKMPHIKVSYEMDDGNGGKITKSFRDVDLPHRAFDAHIRVGSVNGRSTSRLPEYIAARNSTLANMRPLFDLSPITVAMGGWDSTRNKNQLRVTSSFNGEIIGVLANQNEGQPVYRAGARVDPVEASIKFRASDASKVAEPIKEDLSQATFANFTKGTKGKDISGSTIGLGAIPPSAARGALDGIAVSSILRTHILSFSTLRSMRFNAGREGDEAIRTLLSAMLIDAMAGSNSELLLRANCFLREVERPITILDKRFGEKDEIEMLTVKHADELLEQAYDQAHSKAGVDWHGQTLDVAGNQLVLANATADESEKQ